MSQRLLTLFGMIEADGSLKRVTFTQAYELAVGKLPNTPLPETYELVHDRACRRFAKTQLLGSDRGYFLHLAGVSLQENAFAAELAALCVDEVRDCMYAEDPKPLYFARMVDDVIRKMEAEPKPRIPQPNELLLDDEIQLLSVDVY